MMNYKSPLISGLVLEPLKSKLQADSGITGVPICDGTACGEILQTQGGSCDFGPGPSVITVQFFAPGAVETPPPCEIRLDFVTPSPGSETGTNCTFTSQNPVAICNGGGVWELTCEVSDSACDLFTEAFVDCTTGSDACPFNP